MKKFIVAEIISFCFLGSLPAQPLKLVSAMAQSYNWQGGKAISRGANTNGRDYTIVLSCDNCNSLIFDSIYIENFRLKFYSSSNILFDSLRHHPALIYIRFDRPAQPAASTRKIHGAGLIVYEYKGKKHTLLIKQLSCPPTHYGWKPC